LLIFLEAANNLGKGDGGHSASTRLSIRSGQTGQPGCWFVSDEDCWVFGTGLLSVLAELSFEQASALPADKAMPIVATTAIRYLFMTISLSGLKVKQSF